MLKQRRKARIRVIQMKKLPKRIESNLSDQHNDDYDIDEFKNTEFSSEVNLKKIKNSNIGYITILNTDLFYESIRSEIR